MNSDNVLHYNSNSSASREGMFLTGYYPRQGCRNMQAGKRDTSPAMATLWVSLNGPNTIRQTYYLQTPAAKSTPGHGNIYLYLYLLLLASAFTRGRVEQASPIALPTSWTEALPARRSCASSLDTWSCGMIKPAEPSLHEQCRYAC